jgi:signal transduction histidine kinase
LKGYVKGDPELLKRAFINLLDNAIKYTNPPGEIVLSLTAASKFAQVTI